MVTNTYRTVDAKKYEQFKEAKEGTFKKTAADLRLEFYKKENI